MKFVKGDIRSFDLVLHVLNTERINTVMHFAAQSHVDNSFNNSFEFTKIEGTHVLLEACRLAQKAIRRFLHVSTDESALGELNNDSKH